MEMLEERRVLATFAVTTTEDQFDGTADGGLALREAIEMANANPGSDVITMSDQVYELTQPVTISDDLVIFGRQGAVDLQSSRAFNVAGDVGVTIGQLTIQNGRANGPGGAMRVSGGADVILSHMMFVGNRAIGQDGEDAGVLDPGPGEQGGHAYGGALHIDNAGGTVWVFDSEFKANKAIAGEGGVGVLGDGGMGGEAAGGAISTVAGATFIENTRFEGNDARGGNGGATFVINQGGDGGNALGGAIYKRGGALKLDGVAFTSNRALGGNGHNDIVIDESFDKHARLESFGSPGDNGDGRGGAVYNDDGALDIATSTFMDNGAAGGRLDLDRPFKAGDGANSQIDGANGGHASGGAIHIQAGSFNLGQSAFIANFAYGSNGGNGGGSYPTIEEGERVIPRDGRDGGNGGNGGDAIGAAVHSNTPDPVTISETHFVANLAIAGVGGAGGFGHAKETDNAVGGSGGAGGNGGTAGGTLSITDRGQAITVTDSLFSRNKLAGGDGGQGRHGGFGAKDNQGRGGDGGAGGHGGEATGGGISILEFQGFPPVTDRGDDPNVIIENSTFTENVLAGGWGGHGGHGGDGLEEGGAGGLGGDAGKVSGGGIAIEQATAEVRFSTIYANLVIAGDGGHGGNGGDGFFEGGRGGNSGRGGVATAGGVYFVLDDELPPARLWSATIAANVIEAGSSGVPGYGGGAVGDAENLNAHRSHFRPMGGRLRARGATAILLNPPAMPGIEIPLDTPTPNVVDAAPDPANEELVAGLIEIGAFAGGAAGGLTAAVGSLAFTALFGQSSAYIGLLAETEFLAAAGTASSGASLGVAAIGAVSFSTVGLAVAAGLYTTGLGIYFSIQEGGLQAGWDAMYDYLDLGTCERNDLSVLIGGGGNCDDNLPPPMNQGQNGERGAPVRARGAGVLVEGGGELVIGRTIVADNKGITLTINPDEAQLSKEGIVAENNLIVDVGGTVLPVVVADGVEGLPSPTLAGQPGYLGPDNELSGASQYTITLENRDIAAFDSTVTTWAANFVGATDLTAFDSSNQFQDQWGTPQNPLKLRSVGYLAMNGGKTPTLKLREDSPARDAFTSASFTTQNDYHHDPFGGTDPLADIGAWGGGENQTPVAQEVVFEMVQGGELVLTAEDLLASASDANDDPLFVKGGEWSELGVGEDPPNTDGVDFRGLHGNASISGQTGNLVGTGPNVLIDGSWGQVAEITYALDPDDPFTGEEQFTYWVSDGQSQTPVTATVRVVSELPVVEDFSLTGSPDTPVVFGSPEFYANYSDPNGDPPVDVTIVSLPEAGGRLEFAGEPIVAGRTLPVDAILAFIPEQGFLGSVTFDYSVSDGVDSSNVATVTINIESALLGDFNNNGSVDGADFTVWRDQLGRTVAPGTGADASGDGVVGAEDYTLWKANYGQTSPTAATEEAADASPPPAAETDSVTASVVESTSPAAQSFTATVAAESIASAALSKQQSTAGDAADPARRGAARSELGRHDFAPTARPAAHDAFDLAARARDRALLAVVSRPAWGRSLEWYDATEPLTEPLSADPAFEEVDAAWESLASEADSRGVKPVVDTALGSMFGR